MKLNISKTMIFVFIFALLKILKIRKIRNFFVFFYYKFNSTNRHINIIVKYPSLTVLLNKQIKF